MSKTILILVVVIVLALIVFGVLYYIGALNEEFMKKEKSSKEEKAAEEESAEEKAATSEIVSLYLLRIPAGTEIGQETEGTRTSTFEKGDLIQVEGELKFAEGKDKAVLTSQVFDEEGKQLEQIFTPEAEITAPSFGSCCVGTPEEAGKYTLKFFLDGKETKSIEFEVKQ